MTMEREAPSQQPTIPTGSDRNTDDLYKALQDNAWAGGNILRGELPRMVVMALEDFTALTARVEFHRWVFLVPGGAGVADVVYVCVKNAANAYEFLDISTPTTAGSSTSDLKDNMVANGLVADGGATPLNLDGGKATVGEIEIDGALNHDGLSVGFYGTAPITKQSVTGSTGANAALISLLTVLDDLGLLNDTT